MNTVFPLPESRRLLATDLDGTLIPLQDNSDNLNDLSKLKALLGEHEIPIIFVTGRHLESVLKAMDEFSLPIPEAIICDVGTTIVNLTSSGAVPEISYQQHLNSKIQATTPQQLQTMLKSIDGLELQEPEKQGLFKLSFYTDQTSLTETTRQIELTLQQYQTPWRVISSVDPFNGDGLIDFLPIGVSKAYALDWWSNFNHFTAESVIFAGDSGNDLAAFLAGYHSIVVGNASEELRRQVNEHYHSQSLSTSVHLAENCATSGVLEGCQKFGLFGRSD